MKPCQKAATTYQIQREVAETIPWKPVAVTQPLRKTFSLLSTPIPLKNRGGLFFFSPEWPADDDVALDGDCERGVDWAGLRDEGERVDEGHEVREELAVVEGEKERRAGVAVHSREAERTNENRTLSWNYTQIRLMVHRIPVQSPH